MAHCRPTKGFLFASSISVYDPPGGDTPVPETHPFGIHFERAYAFTKVANEAVISYLSRSLEIPATIIRVGSASGVDGGPTRQRLDRIVAGKPIRLHPDKPNYTRPIFEPDCARLGVAALESGRVHPLVVNWCRDYVVSVEEYCTYMGELVGKEPMGWVATGTPVAGRGAVSLVGNEPRGGALLRRAPGGSAGEPPRTPGCAARGAGSEAPGR